MPIGRVLTVVLALMLAMPSAASALTYEVDNAGDVSGGACTAAAGDCSLRAAMDLSNGTPAVTDDIVFEIPGTGVHVITPTSQYTFTDEVNVDATTENDYDGSQPLIEINGTGTVGVGLQIQGGASTFEALAVHGFINQQIFFQTLDGNTLTASRVGTNAAGTASSPDDDASTGVLITNNSDTESDRVGGERRRNVISGVSVGIASTTTGNSFINNYVGTDAAGAAALGNGSTGMGIGANDVIGAPVANGGNVISGNGGHGIQLVSGSTSVRNTHRHERRGHGGYP